MKVLSEKQISEFVTALKRKEIPLKLEYLGAGARRYLAFGKIGMYQTEAMLIKNNSDSIASIINDVNVVYTGCGDGYKIFPLVQKLIKNNKINIFLLDISKYMLDAAKRNLTHIFKKKVNVRTYLLDFESGNFAPLTRTIKRITGKNNLLVLIGNTLGNLSERKRILTNFRESMTLSDYLMLGLHLRSNTIVDRIKAFTTKNVFDFVETRLNDIAKTTFYTKIYWNQNTRNIEFRVIFKKDVRIDYKGEELKFRKGCSLLINTVHLFSLGEIYSLLNDSGFKVIKKFTDKNQEEIILLCQPISL